MKLFRINFPELVVLAEDESDAEQYILGNVEDADFYQDFYYTEYTEITNEQQVPEDWDLGSIPWGGESTTRQNITIGSILDSLKKEGESKEFISELKDLIEKYE